MPCVIAIDSGTSSTRVMVFSAKGDVLAVSQKELPTTYPQNGWVEQNPEDIWNDTLAELRDVYGQCPDALAIGITNQRETTIVWDRRTGIPLYNAIVWQDRRTVDVCQTLKNEGHEDNIRQKTGLLLDPYFSATKIHWILENVDGARAAATAGHLAFGTVDCFLLWRLTGGAVHATDVSNASRTMLLNIRTLEWDDELLEIFNIPKNMFPSVHENVFEFGVTAQGILPRQIPISGMAGDQQAALIGQACIRAGMIKSTYGTGCFALMNIGAQPILSNHQLLTSVGYKIQGTTAYVLEGSIFVAGAAIQWLRDGLHIIEDSAETDASARSVEDNGGVYFIPAFTGLGAPYWKPDVRGAIFGITRGTSSAHLVRAALEAQAYQTRDLMNAFVQDSRVTPDIMRVDGGLISNQFMVQFLSDMIGIPVDIPKCHETTALGAAYLALLGQGIYTSINDVETYWQLQEIVRPQMNEHSRSVLYEGWQAYIRCLI